MDDWLEELNPEQREAVTHEGEGSVLVVAGDVVVQHVRADDADGEAQVPQALERAEAHVREIAAGEVHDDRAGLVARPRELDRAVHGDVVLQVLVGDEGLRVRHLGQRARRLQVVAELGIAEAEVGMALVNGRHASIGQELCDGNVLALFPLLGGG